jgi:hypothetical protein
MQPRTDVGLEVPGDGARFGSDISLTRIAERHQLEEIIRQTEHKHLHAKWKRASNGLNFDSQGPGGQINRIG